MGSYATFEIETGVPLPSEAGKVAAAADHLSRLLATRGRNPLDLHVRLRMRDRQVAERGTLLPVSVCRALAVVGEGRDPAAT